MGRSSAGLLVGVRFWPSYAIAATARWRTPSARLTITPAAPRAGYAALNTEGQRHGGCTKPPAGKFVQVQACNAFSCGLRPSGLVECWGNDRKGQATSRRWTSESGIARSRRRIAVDATRAGRDARGPRPEVLGRQPQRTKPEHVDGPWEQVACGSKATCAIADGGSHAECFGAAAHVYDTREKTAFRGRTLEQVSMGHGHLCVLDVEGGGVSRAPGRLSPEADACAARAGWVYCVRIVVSYSATDD